MVRSKYIKNIDISNKFRLSRPTVSRWIDLASKNKNNLNVETYLGKTRIINSTHNWAELERLSTISEKYKYSHNENLKIVEVSDEFYKIFNEQEIAEIFNKLETKKEIDDKFIYKEDGAKIWDEFYNENETSKLWSIPYIIEELLILALPYLIYHTKNLKINLIDLGPGNSLPLKQFINELLKKGSLLSYVGVDISEAMLKISKNNIQNWFPELKYSELQCDLENVNFSNFFLQLKLENSINVIVHTGGTISNHSDMFKVLKNIRNAMGLKDLFIFSCTLDTIASRTEFSHMQTEKADNQDTFVPNLLGIDTIKCKFEVKFDDQNNRKLKTLVLDKDYVLNFRIGRISKSIKLFKNTEIVVWQHNLLRTDHLYESLKQLDINIISTIQDVTGKQLLVICNAG